MLEITYTPANAWDFDEMKKINTLYEEVTNILLSKKANKTYKYNKQYFNGNYELSLYPETYKNRYIEDGSVEFKNLNGDIIQIIISRWHAHKHNGCGGINGYPCLGVAIYKVNGEESELIWGLGVESGTMYWHAEYTSDTIPFDILKSENQKTLTKK